MRETYTVKTGDTLYDISYQYSVSVTELAIKAGKFKCEKKPAKRCCRKSK